MSPLQEQPHSSSQSAAHARLELLEQTQQERDTLRDNLQAREQRIQLLMEENRWLKQQLFGRSSEQRTIEEHPAQQRLIFNEAEVMADILPVVTESITIPAHDRKQRGRKALPRELPRIDVIHDLPDTDRVCANVACAQYGTLMNVIGEATSEQLDYIPAKVRVLKHIRLKYACACCQQGVKTAAVPLQLLPKSNATPGLLAHIVTAKYVDATPLYRQEAQFKRIGIELPRATSAGWMIKLGHAVQPVINLLNDYCVVQPLIHMDETPLQVLKHDKHSDHYLWVRCAGPPSQRIVLFDYDPSRSAQVPKRILQDYGGILLTDGYEAYDAALTSTAITHAACFAHVRRKFDEARKAAATPDNHATIALNLIGQLYQVERQIKILRTAQEERGTTLSEDALIAQRTQHSAPVLTQFKAWLEHLAPQVLDKSALGKAIHYTLHQWPKLITFLNHAACPLDNNRAENAIRPFVIGRKNWLFCDTQAGARASANLYSLIETAKANGLEPHAYLTRLFTELPKATSLTDIEALLPFKIKTAAA